MNFLTSTVTIFLVGTVLSSLVEAIPPPFSVTSNNVQSLCAAASCLEGSVCRFVKATTSPHCHAFASCLSCVPKGVDDVCNAKRYINAVLIGNKKRYGRLMPQYCDPNVDNDKSGCPEGSVCASYNSKTGHCCYGKPDSLDGPVVNEDTKCDASERCWQKCKKGYSCEPKISDCGKLVYKCQRNHKSGRCPPVPYAYPGVCAHIRVSNLCKTDTECEEEQKCCKTYCGGSACLSPF